MIAAMASHWRTNLLVLCSLTALDLYFIKDYTNMQAFDTRFHFSLVPFARKEWL